MFYIRYPLLVLLLIGPVITKRPAPAPGRPGPLLVLLLISPVITKYAHRTAFAHAGACTNIHHTQHDTQCTHKNLHTAGSLRMRTRTQTNTTHIKTHNAHTKTCTPQGVCACARVRRHARDTQCTRENLHTAGHLCMRAHTKAFNEHNNKNAKREASRTRICPLKALREHPRRTRDAVWHAGARSRTCLKNGTTQGI